MKKISKELSNLEVDRALSPLDGRYSESIQLIREIWSERNLNRCRVRVELLWLLFLAKHKSLSKSLPSLDSKKLKTLSQILSDEKVINEIAIRAKSIEKTTRHDVKAVEYSICEYLTKIEFNPEWKSIVHFACTSEDINNASYAIMLKSTVNLLVEYFRDFVLELTNKAKSHYTTAMLSRTHGQPASPTTLGKEWLVFALRLSRVIEEAKQFRYYVKFSGAVGNYHAHSVTFSEVDWNETSREFVEKDLDMDHAVCSTQIEPHDYVAKICHWMIRLNSILLDFVRDMWTYISLDYFLQKNQKNEVGSSTMPHKINPIDFENAEGNIGLAVAMFQHFATKLPVSRLQRDLSDSTVQRSLGVAFGYSFVALKSCMKGLERVEVNEEQLKNDLSNRWEILGEAVQSILRVSGFENAYEMVKEKTRGKKWDKDAYHKLIESLPILNKKHKKLLLELTPLNYIGQSENICKVTEKIIYNNLK